jgi:hypothetical protein
VSLSGDIPVPHCRRCGSRRYGHGQALLGRSGFSNIDTLGAGIGSSKAQHGPLIVSSQRQTRVRQRAG